MERADLQPNDLVRITHHDSVRFATVFANDTEQGKITAQLHTHFGTGEMITVTYADIVDMLCRVHRWEDVPGSSLVDQCGKCGECRA